jgi:6-pyruvoyl-tetrahydropterin synthase
MNVQTLDQIVRTHILTRFDQRNLNQDPAFANIPVTDSSLAEVIWKTLSPHFHTPPLYRVSVSQQPGTVAFFSA